MWQSVVASAALIVCLGLSGCGSPQPTPTPTPTPTPGPVPPTAQVAWDRYLEAWRAKDSASLTDFHTRRELSVAETPQKDSWDLVDVSNATEYFQSIFDRVSGNPEVLLATLDVHPGKSDVSYGSFVWSSAADNLFVSESLIWFYEENIDIWLVAYHAIFVDSSPVPQVPGIPSNDCRTASYWERELCNDETPFYFSNATFRSFNHTGESGLVASDEIVDYLKANNNFLPATSLTLRRTNDFSPFPLPDGSRGQLRFIAGPINDDYTQYPWRFFTMLVNGGEEESTSLIAYQFLATWRWMDPLAEQVMQV